MLSRQTICWTPELSANLTQSGYGSFARYTDTIRLAKRARQRRMLQTPSTREFNLLHTRYENRRQNF